MSYDASSGSLSGGNATGDGRADDAVAEEMMEPSRLLTAGVTIAFGASLEVPFKDDAKEVFSSLCTELTTPLSDLMGVPIDVWKWVVRA